MSDVRVDMSVSLDGFIAGTGAKQPPYLDDGFFRVTNWVVKHFAWQEQHGLEGAEASAPLGDPEAAHVAERIERTGAYILGRQMYDSAGDEWNESAPYKVPTFILTHRPRPSIPLADGTTFHFVTGGIEEAVARAKEAAGPRDVHISGGARTVQQALSAGLVDELHLDIAPVLLGQGIRLFDNLPERTVELDRIRVLDSTDATHLGFRIVKG